MAVQVLVGEGANLLVNGIFVAADAFGFAYGFQCAEDLADFAAQRQASWPTRKGQLGFTDIHQPCDVTRVFTGIFFFSSSQRV
jgi:hypothetical protein